MNHNYGELLEENPHWFSQDWKKDADVYAFHEAGHIAMALKCGIRVNWAALTKFCAPEGEWDNRGVAQSDIVYPDVVDTTTFRNSLSVMAAGFVSQVKYSEQRHGRLIRIQMDKYYDDQMMHELVRKYTGCDVCSFDDAREQVWQQLDDTEVWTLVTTIAVALHNQGGLDADAILALTGNPTQT